jgi:hypothetical protein
MFGRYVRSVGRSAEKGRKMVYNISVYAHRSRQRRWDRISFMKVKAFLPEILESLLCNQRNFSLFVGVLQ